MVMTCTPNSCTGRIFSDTGCLFTTYSSITSVAQKIADFVMGIFTEIANFVNYYLCTSPTTTTIPALNPAISERGKEHLLDLCLGFCQVYPRSLFLGELSMGRESHPFARLLIFYSFASQGTSLVGDTAMTRFLQECDVASNSHLMQGILDLYQSYRLLTREQKQEFMNALTNREEFINLPPGPVANLLAAANSLRQPFCENPLFCATAQAAREEFAATLRQAAINSGRQGTNQTANTRI